MDLSDIAARIDAHMRRRIGVGARAALGRVVIKYSFGNAEHWLGVAEAERYLAWLDAGNVGRHWEMT